MSDYLPLLRECWPALPGEVLRAGDEFTESVKETEERLPAGRDAGKFFDELADIAG